MMPGSPLEVKLIFFQMHFLSKEFFCGRPRLWSLDTVLSKKGHQRTHRRWVAVTHPFEATSNNQYIGAPARPPLPNFSVSLVFAKLWSFGFWHRNLETYTMFCKCDEKSQIFTFFGGCAEIHFVFDWWWYPLLVACTWLLNTHKSGSGFRRSSMFK